MWNKTKSAPLGLLLKRSWRPTKSALTGRPLNAAPSVRGQPDPNYRTMILTSIKDIDGPRWDSLVGPGAVTRSHAYLVAIEAAGIVHCQYFYPVIFNSQNEIVAHACVYTVLTDFAQLLPRSLRALVAVVRVRCPSFLHARITECASPLVVGHSISISSDAPRAQLLKKIADAATDIAYSQRSPVVLLRDFLVQESVDIGTLLEHGFNLVSNLPLARIRVRWKSYAEYLAGMRPRYRKDVQRRLRLATQARQAVHTLHAFGDQAEHFLEQARVVYEASRGFKREALTADYYREMDRMLGAHSRLLVVMRDGRAVAHGMVLTDDKNTVATFFGRDPGPPGREWFLLVNEVIRLGIERGSRYIHLGLGAYCAKALVGADFESLAICCKSPYAILNWLMRAMPNVVNRRATAQKHIFLD